MKLAVDKSIAPAIQHLQQCFSVTIISDKGLVFMHRDDWLRICVMLKECSDILPNGFAHNTLADVFSFWSECFTIADDKSEDYSCHAICNFDLFALCCRRCNIWPVLLPMWDLIFYVKAFNAHSNHDALGRYIKSRGDVLIEVEDN